MTRKNRKTPRPHHVRSHTRKGSGVNAYSRGSGSTPTQTNRSVSKSKAPVVSKGLKGIDFDRGYLTEREVNLLKRRLTHGQLKFDEIPFPEDGFKLSDAQTKKGMKWLMNQWKTPRGVERKNNPFGYREQAVLDDFKEFRLQDFYNSGRHRDFPFYVPYYRVESTKGSFEYAVYGGEIHIMG